MSQRTRGQAASPGTVITKPDAGRRCRRCGASPLKIVENPVTKKLQCRVCGARQI